MAWYGMVWYGMYVCMYVYIYICDLCVCVYLYIPHEFIQVGMIDLID